MNNSVKVGIYVFLSCAALWFGLRFYAEFKQRSDITTATLPGEVNDSTSPAATDPNLTNNAISATNEDAVASMPTNQNDLAASTNGNETTNPIASTASSPEQPPRVGTVRKGKWMANLGAFLGIAIILGLLAAHDVSQFIGNRSVDFLFNDDLKGVHNPEYEEAEALWSNGQPLDAIRAMREYLKKNPREQYVALRIAEIYEKDLGNYLAAALEYEQVLAFKLPRERWGWAAIHLCNLYIKMGKNDQCVTLLRRIESEYAETAAAKKARQRLATFASGGDVSTLAQDLPENSNAPAPEMPPAPKKVVEEPASQLPPGFRPKK